MKAVLCAGVAAITLTAGAARAAVGVPILTGAIPDGGTLTVEAPVISDGRYVFYSDGVLISDLTLAPVYDFTDRYLVGKDASIVPLPDVHLDAHGFGVVASWIRPNDDGGILISFYGLSPTFELLSCCYAGVGDPYFYKLHEFVTQTVTLNGLFSPESVGQGYSLNFVSRLGPVPEPATWAMMIVGFGMAGAVLRRRPVLS